MQNLNQTTTKYNVAIYCRLSRDDGTDAFSQSIVSQKESLSKYVLEKGWEIGDVYVDDGYSGTNFNRPAFKRMINDIENNKINCVITKDLSRLGRDYLETGYYTEKYFPLHNVRYIAVNDAYDSLDEDNDFTPFKNIINEWYAKDISKKIKSSFRHRQKEGTLVINSPYGYLNDNKKGRIKDQTVAPIVEYIFTQFAEVGLTVNEIAEKLTKKKILTPKAYRSYYENRNNDMPEGYTIEDTYTWSKGMIYAILNEYQYTGALICNKGHNLSFKVKKSIRNEKSDWIIHEDKFEPIISKQLFNKAKDKLNKSAKAQLPLYINKYNGILYCKDCGRKATFLRNVKNPNGLYLCRVVGCPSKRVSIEDLDEIIKKEIIFFKEGILRNEAKIVKFLEKAPANEPSYDKDEVISELTLQKEELMKSLAEAFEAKCNGEIPPSVYEKIKNDFNVKINDISSKLEVVKNGTMESKYDVSGALLFLENIKGFNEFSNITRTILTTLIERINFTEDVLGEEKVIKFEITYRGIDWLVKNFEKIIK